MNIMKLARDILNKILLSFNLSVWCPHLHLHESSENKKEKNLQT